MFLSMVFFLLCFFVGGSVLAAATANGGRLARSQESMASYYAQRSAVSLLREQFTSSTTMSIKLITTKTTTITSGSSTSVTTQTAECYDVETNANQTTLQQLVSQAALAVYKEHHIEDNRLKTKKSDSTNTMTVNGETSGDLTMSLSGVDSSTRVTVHYTCSYDSDSGDFGDIVFSVYTDESSDSQFCLVIPASVNVVKTTSNQSTTDTNTSTIVRTTTESVNVTWGTPEIQKGGAA
jgi:hypothetical protein